MSKVENEVTEFRSHFNPKATTELFTHGQCFWFALILHERFQPFYPTRIFYNPVDNHFATEIYGELYDITGRIEKNTNWFDWNDYILLDPSDAARIYRDCIFQENPEAWDTHYYMQKKMPWVYCPTGVTFGDIANLKNIIKEE